LLGAKTVLLIVFFFLLRRLDTIPHIILCIKAYYTSIQLTTVVVAIQTVLTFTENNTVGKKSQAPFLQTVIIIYTHTVEIVYNGLHR